MRSRRRGATVMALAGMAVVAGVLAPAPAAGAPAPARVERVRYEADGSATRVIVMLSRPVPYEVMVLEGDPRRGSRERVVVDFSNARLGPAARAAVGVEDGILQRIRTGQFTARTTRVVLDLGTATTHRVRALDDPPRVVVDVAAREPLPERAVARPPERAAAPEPPAAVAVDPAPAVAPPDERGERETVGREPATRTATLASVAPASAEVASAEVATEPEPRVAAPAATPEPPGHEEAPAVAGPSMTDGLPVTPWTIVIDPGHGGNDPGASGVDGILEKDVVLRIARRLQARLETELGARVLLTRDGDVTRSLAERTAFANANRADLFISIHANADEAGRLQGIETYTLNNSNDRATIRLATMENGPAFQLGRGDLSMILSDMVQSSKEEESIALAERLHSRLLGRLRTKYRNVHNLGVKKGPFYVLVGAYMPCVLVETSFLSHPVEGRRLATDQYRAEVAEGLFLGIRDFLGDARLAKTL